jgi:hypothetical protein
MQGPPINVWVWHQSTELENLKSDDATAAATARWAGEAALRNATNTTTKGTTTTAAADVRHGPSPLEPPVTDVLLFAEKPPARANSLPQSLTTLEHGVNNFLGSRAHVVRAVQARQAEAVTSGAASAMRPHVMMHVSSSAGSRARRSACAAFVFSCIAARGFVERLHHAFGPFISGLALSPSNGTRAPRGAVHSSFLEGSHS